MHLGGNYFALGQGILWSRNITWIGFKSKVCDETCTSLNGGTCQGMCVIALF